MFQPSLTQEVLPERLKTLLLDLTDTAHAYYNLGQLEHALQFFQLGVSFLHFPEVRQQDQALFLLHQGNMLRAKTQFQNAPVEESVVVLEEVRRLAALLNDEALQATATDGLGFAYYVAASNKHEGNPYQFRLYFQEALELRRKLHDEQGISQSLFHLGLTADVLDERENAFTLYTQALQIARQQNYSEIVAEALRHLGFHAQLRGDFSQAQQYYTEALYVLEQAGAQVLLPFANVVLVDICIKQGDLEAAASYNLKALEISRKMDIKRAYIFSLLAAGRLASAEQDEKLARDYFSEAYILAKAIALTSALQQVPATLLPEND